MAERLHLDRVGQDFTTRAGSVTVLDDVTITLGTGDRLALIASSGAGKSTLLHIAGLLMRPTRGRVWLGGLDATDLNEHERTRLRGQLIGFVFQSHFLINEFSALDNVAIPQRLQGVPAHKANAEARDLLGRIGLAHRLDHRPGQLSGGERQRVAVARAIAGQPALLLADEPTGNLDEENSSHLAELLTSLSHEYGVSLLVATHDPTMAAFMDKTLHLQAGKTALSTGHGSPS